MSKSNESSEALRKMKEALSLITSHMAQAGVICSELAEFYTDASHAAAHRMTDSLTTQLAVVLTQRMAAPGNMSQVLISGFQMAEAERIGDMAHDLVLFYATDLQLGLAASGYEVMIAYMGTKLTEYANVRLDELGFKEEEDTPESTQDLTN